MIRRLRQSLTLVSLVAGLALFQTACQSESRADAPSPQATPSGATLAESTPTETKAGPEVVGFGEPMDIQPYVVPGQITVFDFMSEYCGPCRVFAPYLEKLNSERADLTVVKVDINRPGKRGIDWGSPLARQYGVRSVPHFKVYDPSGVLIAEGRAAQPLVISFIEELPSLQSN